MGRKVTKAIFPVAGLGTRFLPATKSIPKEILSLVDKPLIHYAVEEAQAGRADVFQIRDQKISNSDFHNSSKFLGKGDFVSQTRISDI